MILKKDRARVISSNRRQLVLSIMLISVLVWVLTPPRSESAALRNNRSNQFSNHPYHPGYMRVDVDLTAEQIAALTQASKMLSEPDGNVLIEITAEEKESIRGIIRQAENKGYRSGFKLVTTPGGTFREEFRSPVSSVRAVVENASPFTTWLLATASQFEQHVALTLTEDQRRQFNQYFHRPITELHFERSEDADNPDQPVSKSIYKSLINDVKNIIQPDSYDIYFSNREGKGLKMHIEAKYREIHERVGYYYPDLYPPQSRAQSRESKR